MSEILILCKFDLIWVLPDIYAQCWNFYDGSTIILILVSQQVEIADDDLTYYD